MMNLQFFCLKHYFVCGSVSIWEQSYPLRLCWGKRSYNANGIFKYCKESRQISSFQNFLFFLTSFLSESWKMHYKEDSSHKSHCCLPLAHCSQLSSSDLSSQSTFPSHRQSAGMQRRISHWKPVLHTATTE
jgi:hypothetical protein